MGAIKMISQLFTTYTGLLSLGVILFSAGMGIFFIRKALKGKWD